MKTIRVHLDKRQFLLAACVIAVLCLAYLWVAPPVWADATQESEIAQLEQTIEQEGLSWTPKVYDREFSLGAILRADSPNEGPTRGDDAKDAKALSERLSSDQVRLLPSSLDWRDKNGNWVSSVKDQGNCGSCWAFSGVAAMESLYAMAAGTPGVFMDLSEQIAVSCSTNNYGCDGGYMDLTAAFFQNEGTYYESCYPYQAADTPCNNACANWRDNAFKIDSYSFVAQDVTALKTALQTAPFEVAMDVYSDFDNYGSGIYERASNTTLEGGHAILLVGYVDTPGQYGGGYFIVKNSWGTEWGENGFFRIGYSQVTNQVDFGVESYLYAVSGSQEPTPTATAGPNPTPTDTPEPNPTATPNPDVDAFEPDDTPEQASYLHADSVQTHSLMPENDYDWLVFSLVQQDDIVLTTSGSDPEGDTVLYVYNQWGSIVASNDDIDWQNGNLYSQVSETLAPGTYYVEIFGYWYDTVIDEYKVTFETSSASAWSLPLGEGWNLISIPVQPASTAPGDVLASLSGDYDIAMTYVAAQDSWLAYAPSDPGGATLTAIDAQTPLWIQMTAPATLSVAGQEPGTTVQPLVPGWNMVAYPSLQSRSLTTGLLSISGELTSAWGHAGPSAAEPWLQYTAGAPAWANTLTTLEPGHAYWLKVTNECNLTID